MGNSYYVTLLDWRDFGGTKGKTICLFFKKSLLKQDPNPEFKCQENKEDGEKHRILDVKSKLDKVLPGINQILLITPQCKKTQLYHLPLFQTWFLLLALLFYTKEVHY